MNWKIYVRIFVAMSFLGYSNISYAKNIVNNDPTLKNTLENANRDNYLETNKLERQTKLHLIDTNKQDIQKDNSLIENKKIGKIITDKNYNLALTIKSGKILNVAKLDQLVDNLKTNLTEPIIILQPTNDKDVYNIIIKTKRHKNIGVNVTIDDDNDSEYGNLNSYITLSHDYNILPGDEMNIVIREHLSEDRYHHTGGLRYINYSAPIGKYKLGLTRYRNFQKDRLLNQQILTTYSENTNINLSNTYYRDKNKKLGYDITFKNTKNVNKINDNFINISNNSYQSINLGLTSLFYGKNSAFSINPSMEIFRKNWTKNIPDIYKLDYVKFDMVGMYTKNYAVTPNYYDNYTLNWGLSYSPTHQINNRQFSIGGINSVRGFKHSTVRGDKGLYLQNTFSRNFKHFSPFIGVDFGISRDYALPKSDYLVGIAIGSKYRYQNLSASLTISQPLHVGDKMIKEKFPLYINVNYSF